MSCIIFVCVAVLAHHATAQFPMQFNRFSGIGGGNIWGAPTQFPQNNGQQQNTDYQYLNCMSGNQNTDNIRVTFRRPVDNSRQDFFSRMQPRQWWETPDPVHMSAVVSSAQTSQFTGLMQMVITENGAPADGMCNPYSMGRVIAGTNRNQQNQQRQQAVPFWNQFNQQRNQPQNQQQNTRVGGVVGSPFNLQNGRQVLMSELVYVDFDEIAGSGISFCRNVNGNSCNYMLNMCCTLGKGDNAVAGSGSSNGMNQQFGNQGQFDQFGNPQNQQQNFGGGGINNGLSNNLAPQPQAGGLTGISGFP